MFVYLVLLSKISRHLLRKNFLEMLNNGSKEEIVDKILEPENKGNENERRKDY